jgi:two-component system cell cycle sensor histidine kinase/response regulator CckA
MLLAGLTGVTCLGLIVMRGSPEHAADPELAPERLLEALDQGAVVVAADGRLQASNRAWRDGVGPAARLPKTGPAAVSLFAAMAAARKGEPGRAVLRVGGADRAAVVTPLGARRFLIRLAGEPGAGALPAAALEVITAFSSAGAPPPKVLDAFAAASPFGAALLEGEDPFAAVIVEANPALKAVAGGGEPGQAFGELIDAPSRADAAQKLAAGTAGGAPLEVRLAQDAARIAHLYLSRTDGRWVAYLVDVSEQKQIELQLAQSQKMQAIGQLAGGVAHDFNNLLTAIFMQLDVLASRHPVGDPSYEGLNEIRQTSTRAADLVRKLLAFSRKQTVQREILDLGELISEFEVLLRRVLYEDVKLATEYGRNLPQVRIDRSQLETAVMNLAVNARDAVRAHGGGQVTIRTGRLTQEQAIQMGYPGAQGEQALIEVADDGPGIPPEIRDKIFVEDEDAVRGVAAKLLRARGYEVIEAASGEEALELAEAHAGEIDLMISDVVMPGMQGPDLLKAARDYLGTAPVMFISGYAESEFSDLLEGESNISFLPKPIDIKTLAERVKQELQKAA